GGGGGLAGPITDPLTVLVGATAGATGKAGSGGDVSVTQHGDITTSGDHADGIFAQSSAADGYMAGKVTVHLTGNISATGLGSDGIYAASTTGGVGNDITITIDQGSRVMGGHNLTPPGIATKDGAAGVHILGGGNNTITNDGFISSAGDLAVLA